MGKNKNKYSYYWDEEHGMFTTTIYDKKFNKCYRGLAICHPDDKEYQNQAIGQALADYRAQRRLLIDIKNNELAPQIAILKHLLTNMETSKRHNPKSYEARMIRRQLRIKEQELESVKEMIAQLSANIADYAYYTDKAIKRFNKDAGQE